MRYSDTTKPDAEQDDLIGSPTLDRPIRLTRFPTIAATRKKSMKATLRRLAMEIETTVATDKLKLPGFKCATFGNDTSLSPSGRSYRTNANMLAVSGLEADYDREEITPEDAVDILTEAGIPALVYTTPSHSPDAPRWRVITPFSEEHPPQDRARFMARLNGLFDGVFDDASFTPSQFYYGGNVTDRPRVKTYLVEGHRYIDAAADLDATAKWKRGREKQEGAANDNSFDEAAFLDAIVSGESYHPSVVALAGKWAAAGVAYAETMQRLMAAFLRSPDRGERWHARMAALASTVNDIYTRQAKEDATEKERHEEAFDDLAWEEFVRDFTAVPPDPDIQADIDELVGDPTPSLFAPASSWAKDEPPRREWLVDGLIPNGTVTMLGGDGGTGKSLLALQLAVATATGGRWIGRDVDRPGKVMFLSAEDDRDELHRRLSNICDSDGIGLRDLDRLLVRSLATEGALLATLDRKTNTLKTTALYDTLDKAMAAGPSLLVLDTLADLHSGEENQRAHARQFIGMLRGLAIRHNCAVLLLAHPSLTGMANGSGLSGSTAWNASVRSRLYLDRVKDEQGIELDADTRVLKTVKANYGATGGEIIMHWRAGAFVADVQDFSEPHEEKAARVFLKLLDAFTAKGRYVSPNVSSTYAPSVFAAHPEREGVGKLAFMKAMERLLTENVIAIGEHGKAGKERQHLERANP